MKALEIKTYLLFTLVFAKNTNSSCFFLVFDLYFLILAVIAQIFIFQYLQEYQLKKQKQNENKSSNSRS